MADSDMEVSVITSRAEEPPSPGSPVISPIREAATPVSQDPRMTPTVEASARNIPTGPITHTFNVKENNIHSYAPNMPSYDGNSRESWIIFKEKLKGALRLLGRTTDTWKPNSFRSLLEYEEFLSHDSTDLLMAFIIPFFTDKANLKVQRYSESEITRTLFADMINELEADWKTTDSFTRGVLLFTKLYEMIYKPGTDVRSFNREYSAVFTELVELGEFPRKSPLTVNLYFKSFTL